MSFILADLAHFVMPVKAATFANEVDWLMWFNFWVCIIFGILIFVGTGWLAWRFKHKVGVNDVGRGPTHSNLLEIVWSVIPLIIVLLIAIWGFQGYMTLAILPPANDADTMEIGVEAYKWGWRFNYPNGYSTNTLHVPLGVKVRLVESSADVIHSLFLPQFRIKKDAVPGRFNKQWFEASEISPIGKDLGKKKDDGTYEELNWADPLSFEVDKSIFEADTDAYKAHTDADRAQMRERMAGGFDIFCTEYCGTGHSQMLSKVYVHPSIENFRVWLAAASDVYRDTTVPAKDIGAKLVSNNGCFACHNVSGAGGGTGPTWKDLYGEPVKFTDGSALDSADENYIRESILYPQKKIVVGYGGAMPSYLGKFSDRDLIAITAFMKANSSHFKGNSAEFTAPTPMANMDKNKTK